MPDRDPRHPGTATPLRADAVVRLPLADIAYRAIVQGSGAPLLLLHGFTGSADSWLPHLPALAARYRVIAVDHIGHGGTDAPADPDRYRMEHAARDLLEILDLVAGPGTPVHVLGYSMGGRLALHLAVTAPARVAALVLESASPGIADADERALRAAADAALATRIEREGVVSFVAYWESVPLFATQQRLPPEVQARQRAQRLACSATGLANSLRGLGAGVQAPLHEHLADLPMPVLALAGALDNKYRSLAEWLARRIPGGRTVIVPDTGHAVHLEQPAVFDHLVLEFLETICLDTP